MTLEGEKQLQLQQRDLRRALLKLMVFLATVV